MAGYAPNPDDIRSPLVMPRDEKPLKENLIEEIYHSLGCKEPHTKKFIKVMLDCIKLFDIKQHDYGPGNISKFLEVGVIVRLSDKIERLINLWKKGALDMATCESAEDTWQDICNYGAIGLMCRRETWTDK